MFQLDFLVAAKLIHLVSDVVFEALDVFLVGAVDEVKEDARCRFYLSSIISPTFFSISSSFPIPVTEKKEKAPGIL